MKMSKVLVTMFALVTSVCIAGETEGEEVFNRHYAAWKRWDSRNIYASTYTALSDGALPADATIAECREWWNTKFNV